MKESNFVEHCDHESCDLGVFEYTCPGCNAPVIDYEVWWEQSDILSGKTKTFKCEKCEETLTVKWDNVKYEYSVQVKTEIEKL